MTKKAAIALSMNFMVTIIIALVVFSFGVGFVYTIVNNANTLKEMTTEDIDSKISDLLCKNTQKVCVEKEILELKPGELEIVGIRILNIETGGPELTFKIKMEPGIFVDNDNNDQPTHPTPGIFVMPNTRSETIKQNDMLSMGFGFEIEKKAVRGTYVFNLNVEYPDGTLYDKTRKIRIKVS